MSDDGNECCKNGCGNSYEDICIKFESQSNARNNISCICANWALIKEVLGEDDIKRIVKSNFQKLEQ